MSGYIRGERCGEENCSSRRFTIDGRGHEICERGHDQGLARGGGQDEDEFLGASQGRTTRRKETEQLEKVFTHFQGREAFELYLLCYQLILRKQVWWLVHEKGLPPELEIMVRDLWTLRLQNLTNRMPSEPSHDSESQSQLFSSQSEDTAEPSSGTDFTTRAAKSISTPNLVQSLALCYMGANLLRLPLYLGDFLRWAKQGELLYYRAIKKIPRDMRDRLPGQYHRHLDPQTLLTPRNLYHAVTALFLLYQKDFGVAFPALNMPLLLFRYIEDLALPIETYSGVKRLASLLSYDFKYPQEVDQKKRRQKLHVIDFPDPQLVSTLIVAVKLLYPFDRIKRYPASGSEPTAAVLDWAEWEKATKDFENGSRQVGRLDFEDAVKATEMDALEMSDTKIDDYLDYYDKMWTAEEPTARDKDSDFRKTLMDMFPIGQRARPPSREQDADSLKSKRMKAVQESLRPRKVITEKQEAKLGTNVPRPGSLYRRYRKVQDLDGHLKSFYATVADLAGLSLKNVVRAVFLTEERLQHQKEQAAIDELLRERDGVATGLEMELDETTDD